MGKTADFMEVKKLKGEADKSPLILRAISCVYTFHAANKADTAGGCVLMKLAKPNLPPLKAVCAYAGYRGTFETFMQEEFELPVHTSQKTNGGFAVIPKRWDVERTFAWFNGQHRLSKDYERDCRVSESMVYVP